MEENLEKKRMECNYHTILMFYIPLVYAIETRFLRRSKWGIMIWGTEYLLPVLLTMSLINNFDFTFLALFSIIGVYNFYEIGYIQNDCETIKKEERPTLRISTAGLEFYKKYKFPIYGFKIIIGICLSYFFLDSDFSYITILLFWSIIPLYLLYNWIRNRINLYLILILTTYRYCMPLFLLTSRYDCVFWFCVVVLFITYPTIKLIEICAGGKGLPQESWTKVFMSDYSKRFSFRIRYYLVLSIGIVLILFNLEMPIQICTIPVYFFFLRLAQLKMPKLGPR